MSWGETLFLKNFIKGEKTFVGGTSAISPAYVNSKYYNFTPKLDGVITIIGNATNKHDNDEYLNVSVMSANGTVYTKSISIPPLSNLPVEINIAIEKDVWYRLSLGGNSWITIGDFYFCGQVTDYNYFKTAVIE